jgi:hypothetical protein
MQEPPYSFDLDGKWLSYLDENGYVVQVVSIEYSNLSGS